jgi:hypothetical protein
VENLVEETLPSITIFPEILSPGPAGISSFSGATLWPQIVKLILSKNPVLCKMRKTVAARLQIASKYPQISFFGFNKINALAFPTYLSRR